MITFGEWLFQEVRSLIDPYVLDSYERAFMQQLEALIGRTRDPASAAGIREDEGLPRSKIAMVGAVGLSITSSEP